MPKRFLIPEPRIFAHRGDAAHFPENTLPAFQSAVEAGADVIETDLQRSRDGHFMVFHDETVDRLTDGRGRIGDYTLKELKRMDAGYRFSGDGESFAWRGKKIAISTLAEVLREFPRQRFNIDLKADDPSQADDFCSLIRRCNAAERVLTASRFTGNLRRVRRLLPEMATSASYAELAMIFLLFKCGLLRAKGCPAADALQIPRWYFRWHAASPAFMHRLGEIGIRVHVWTVNKEADMRRLLDAGADGIITDDPGLLKKVIQSR